MDNQKENLRQAKKLAREVLKKQEYKFLRKYNQASDEELADYLRRVAKRLGFAPNYGNVVGADYIKNRFGDWSAALRFAGLSASTAEERAGAGSLFDREVQRQALLHQQAISALAQQERAFSQQHQNTDNSELLAYLQGWAERLKHTPNQCEVIGGEYIKRRFGSWDKAVRLAGLPKPPNNPPKMYHRQIYLDELQKQRLAAKQSEVPPLDK